MPRRKSEKRNNVLTWVFAWLVIVAIVLTMVISGWDRTDIGPDITIGTTLIDEAEVLQLTIGTSETRMSDDEIQPLVEKAMDEWFKNHHWYTLGEELTRHSHLFHDGTAIKYYALLSK